ncbi:unnamed protein product [Rotaria sp. Silwood1]|nr:unnamed protein product [Rotaria sp. Silwood1]
MAIPSTRPYSIDGHISSISASRQLEASKHEETIKLLELERTSLVKELNHLRQLYDEVKSDSIIQKRQIQLLRDFYTEQNEVSKHEQIEYFTRILNLIQDLPDSNRNKNFNRQNSSSLSLEEIRNDLDQRINSVTTNYKSLLMKVSKDKDKSISNDVSLLISKFQDKFSHLFNNNGSDEMTLTTEDTNINNPLLKNIISFLNDLYKQINKILHDKIELSEQLITLEKRHRNYSKIQAKIYKIINEDKHSNSYLKQLANQMTEELDQIEELTDRRSTVTSITSSISTIENKPSRVLSHSLKLQHMEIQQLRIALEREIEVRQQVEEKLKRSEAKIICKIDEINHLKQENELIKKQLVDEQVKHLSITTIPDKSSTTDGSNCTSTHEFLRPITSEPSVLQAPSDKPNINQGLTLPQNEFHDFRINNFSSPYICHHCHDVLIGLMRQGFFCERCEIICHPDCIEKVKMPCEPSNKDPDQANLGVQHIVQIPKAGGIRKGWNQCQILFFQTKLLFYDLSNNSNVAKSGPSLIIDLNDDTFNVCSITPEDAIHAKKRDIPNIFKISVEKLSSPKQVKDLYVLTNNESEKNQYISILYDLSMKFNSHTKNGLRHSENFTTKEIFDISLQKIIGAHILDSNRFLIFGEEGLYLLDIFDNKPTRLYKKIIHQLSLISDNQLLVMLSGKERIIRITPLKCLLTQSQSSWDGKILETKNATAFTVNSTSLTLCVAIKNRLLLYKIHSNPRPYPYTLIHDLYTTQTPTYLELSILKINNNEEEILWYGYSSIFIAQQIDQQCPSFALLRDIDLTLQVFRKLPIDILRVIPVTSSSSINELLLVYSKLGIYVNYSTGMRTRHRELMWAAVPISTSFSDPHLLVYTKISIDIYDVSLGIWLQSLPLSNTFPLTSDGTISLSYDPELVKHHATLIHITQPNRLKQVLNISERSSSTLISEPTNFIHLEHLGRDEGLKILLRSTYNQQHDRVKSTKKTHLLSSLNDNRSLATINSHRSRAHTSIPLDDTAVRLV